VLAEAGFHAVAPVLRGYAPTAVPDDARSGIGALVVDAVALHQVLDGDGDAVLIGHDWVLRRPTVRPRSPPTAGAGW
jgi:hypothetical protein